MAGRVGGKHGEAVKHIVEHAPVFGLVQDEEDGDGGAELLVYDGADGERELHAHSALRAVHEEDALMAVLPHHLELP